VKKLSVARRYAKALLILGVENDQVELYGDELKVFDQVLTHHQELEQTLCNPLYNTDSRKNILKSVLNKMNFSQVVNSFLMLLFDKRRMNFVSNINEFYQKLADELKGVVRANVKSAHDLSAEAKDSIRIALSKLTGKEVQLHVEKDVELIGGIVTKIGDLVLDGSIKKQILSMKESLKRGESI